MTRVRKAVIPAAGLGTRFLPATKSSPKEMLPVVDKPAIQYVVEEAVQAGLTDILIITGRNKRAIEDHFDRNFELEHFLEQQRASTTCLKEVQFASDLADIHYVRQTRPARSRPRGVGRASSRRRRAVRGAARRRHHGRRRRAAALDARRARAARPFGASRSSEVSPEEISSYGCIDPKPRRPVLADGVDRDPARRREAAARGSAVEPRGHRPLRVHARDLHDARPHRARAAAASCSSPTRSRCCSRTRACSAATAGAAATTSARSSTSSAPTSSSRSTGPTSGRRSANGCASTSPSRWPV